MSRAPKFAYQELVDLILDSAAACIEETSLLDFTMSAISRKAGVSMGSIYKHMQSKEDVLVALGHESLRYFENLAREVLALPLPVVARTVAIQLVDDRYASPYSFGAELNTLLGNEAILRRASPGWLEKYVGTSQAVEALFREQLLAACDSGELTADGLSREALADEIVTCIWSICVGHTQVQMQRNIRHRGSRPYHLESDSTIVHGLHRLLNTYSWTTPLTDDLIDQACGLLEARGLR